MKYVTASRVTYDAAEGRIEPGQRYYLEDDKAERWINAGVATLATPPAHEEPKPPQPQPIPPEPIPPAPPEPIPAEPKPEDGDDEEEDDDEEPSAELEAEVKRLFESGQSQRAVAEHLGISRQRVHDLLRS